MPELTRLQRAVAPLLCRVRGHQWRGDWLTVTGNITRWEWHSGPVIAEPELLTAPTLPPAPPPPSQVTVLVQITDAPQPTIRRGRVELDVGEDARHCARCGVNW